MNIYKKPTNAKYMCQLFKSVTLTFTWAIQHIYAALGCIYAALGSIAPFKTEEQYKHFKERAGSLCFHCATWRQSYTLWNMIRQNDGFFG